MFDITQSTDKYMSMVLTHACNKRCPFCVDKYVGRREFISMEAVERALKFAESQQTIEDILMIGGEPTLHPEVVEIAKLVSEFGFRSIMTTNYTRPSVVERLDGIVDCFNISYYNQISLPDQKHWLSDITLHTLIHKHQLPTQFALDEFIDEFEGTCNLKFSTLVDCNLWTAMNKDVPYLDELDCEWVVLFNEILGQNYRGTVIKRYDRVINKVAKQSYKAHVDGTITRTWERPEVQL